MGNDEKIKRKDIMLYKLEVFKCQPRKGLVYALQLKLGELVKQKFLEKRTSYVVQNYSIPSPLLNTNLLHYTAVKNPVFFNAANMEPLEEYKKRHQLHYCKISWLKVS